MSNDRTRTFSATYTSRNNKKQKLNVRIYKRLAAFGLSLLLIKGAYSAVIDLTELGDKTSKQTGLEDKYLEENMALIQSIIDKNPHMLSDISRSTYKVKLGDTLGGIAEKNGNTLKRICNLNDKITNQTIYEGEELIVESITPKEELNKEITTLESYFHDYLFNSPVAELAKKRVTEKDAGYTFRKAIYGTPKDINTPDEFSIYGKYFYLYKDFHDRKEITEDDKRTYIQNLTHLALESENDLNLNGTINNVISYGRYKVYLENRSIEYDVVTDMHRTIYR